MINDLEAPIARHHPEIDQMKRGAAARRRAGRGDVGQRIDRVRPVSAAGRDATAAVDRLSGAGWRVLLTESLGRGEYARSRSQRRPVHAAQALCLARRDVSD